MQNISQTCIQLDARYIQAVQDKYTIPSGSRPVPSPGPRGSRAALCAALGLARAGCHLVLYIYLSSYIMHVLDISWIYLVMFFGILLAYFFGFFGTPEEEGASKGAMGSTVLAQPELDQDVLSAQPTRSISPAEPDLDQDVLLSLRVPSRGVCAELGAHAIQDCHTHTTVRKLT